MDRQKAGDESFIFEGSEYWISVYVVAGGYHAEWACMVCNEQGSPALASQTRAEAIARVKRHLMQSGHRVTHRDSTLR